MVIGSRYVPGGSTSDDWGIFRWLNSRVATLLARPLTNVKDPMSGFFALRKSDFEQARDLNPVGYKYKIALVLIVKCGFENVGEIPIGFIDRVYGESKLTLKEQLSSSSTSVASIYTDLARQCTWLNSLSLEQQASS
jgi:dolichol-phosphate mannosyltransferase